MNGAHQPADRVTLFGVGRLGICTALCLEKAGYHVLGVDVNSAYIDKINNKTLNSPEPSVNEMLSASKNFRATTDEVNQAAQALVQFLRWSENRMKGFSSQT